MEKRAWVTSGGCPASYRLVVAALPEAGDYWPLNGVTFNKYRAAQNVANAVNAAVNAAMMKRKKGAK